MAGENTKSPDPVSRWPNRGFGNLVKAALWPGATVGWVVGHLKKSQDRLLLADLGSLNV